MPFSGAFHFSLPPQHTLRYDLELNLNFELIEAALLGFPSAYAPGSTENYPDVIPSDGMKWLDTGNSQLKVYYDSAWHVIHTFT